MGIKTIRLTDPNGNVLIPGDAILTSCLPIYANADLNDFTKIGSYACDSNSFVGSIKNKPSFVTSAFKMIVIDNLSDYASITDHKWLYFMQIMICIDGLIYVRHFNSGNPATSVSFGEWCPIPSIVRTGSFTANSGFSAGEIDIKQYGRSVYVHFYVRGTIPANTNVVIGAISGVDLPSTYIRWMANGGAQPFGATTPVYAILDKDTRNIGVYSNTAISAVDITVSYIV